MKTLRKFRIEVYGHDDCPYCLRAKALLQEKGWNYIYHNVKEDPREFDKLRQILSKFGIVDKITVPQIFVNGEHIGGYLDFLDYVRDIDDGKSS